MRCLQIGTRSKEVAWIKPSPPFLTYISSKASIIPIVIMWASQRICRLTITAVATIRVLTALGASKQLLPVPTTRKHSNSNATSSHLQAAPSQRSGSELRPRQAPLTRVGYRDIYVLMMRESLGVWQITACFLYPFRAANRSGRSKTRPKPRATRQSPSRLFASVRADS